MESIAAPLGLSRRSLQRRLQDEGFSFRALHEQIRAELACRWLEQSTMALGEVAYLLGFSEPSAFHRAFKRWTGQTPAAYRDRVAQRTRS